MIRESGDFYERIHAKEKGAMNDEFDKSRRNINFYNS
jgi:hypothetical protein